MAISIQGIGNKKASFSVSIWSWRPIYMIINFVNNKYGLRIITESFGYNDESGGIGDPDVCKELGKCISKEMANLGLVNRGDKLYLALGSWCWYPSGKRIPISESKMMGLESYSGKIIETPISTEHGMITPTYYLEKKQLKEFVEFLKVCKGFRIGV